MKQHYHGFAVKYQEFCKLHAEIIAIYFEILMV